MKVCSECGKEHHGNTGPTGSGVVALVRILWFMGFFCPDCFELVSHDSFGNPNHPDQYAVIAVKQRLQRAGKP